MSTSPVLVAASWVLWTVVCTSATYLPWNSREIAPSVNEKSNALRQHSPSSEVSSSDHQQTIDGRQHTAFFRDDAVNVQLNVMFG
jgi:hypothetical protein